MKNLSITSIIEILTGLSQGLSYRKIQQQYGASKSSVARIATKLSSATISATQALKLTDSELQELIYPSEETTNIDPDWDKIHKKVTTTKLTLLQLYEAYFESNHATGLETYTYSSFCRRYKEWKRMLGIHDLAGNFERRPGECMEIDFAGDKLKWVDSYGETHESKIFVACLPYSCMLFAEAFENETQQSWINGTVDALEYMGGSPEVLVMDNAKALIKKTDWREGIPQTAIQSLCTYYGMEPWACKPARPKEKNRVEAAVYDVERWIIAPLEARGNLLARDLKDVNQIIRRRVDEINRQPFRGYQNVDSRLLRFENEERQELSKLPNQPYEHGEWRILSVDKGHCFRMYSDGGHRYSVPVQYARQKVCVRICRNKLEAFDLKTNLKIAEHERCFNTRGEKTHLKPEHLTTKERYNRRSKDDWIHFFLSKGIKRDVCIRYIEALWGHGSFVAKGVCKSVSSLFASYTPQEITQALDRSLEINQLRYYSVKAWCEKFAFAARCNLELDLNRPDPSYVTTIHENVRNDYE